MRRAILIAILSGLAVGCSGSPAATTQPAPAAASRAGTIWFGTDYNPNTLEVVSAFDNFRLSTPEIAWSAHLSEPAGAIELTLVIARRSEGGAEEPIVATQTTLSNPAFDVIANKADLATIVGGEGGLYVMRYLRGSTILAEGTFRLY